MSPPSIDVLEGLLAEDLWVAWDLCEERGWFLPGQEPSLPRIMRKILDWDITHELNHCGNYLSSTHGMVGAFSRTLYSRMSLRFGRARLHLAPPSPLAWVMWWRM